MAGRSWPDGIERYSKLLLLKAVINFARSELALEINNPFVGVYHDRSKGVVTRQPIPVKDIRVVQQQCEKHDDDLRWLIALISDSGMRLAEAAGLLKSDFVNLQGDVPHISLRKHSWRPLKTKSSERFVPLVGKSLWAAQRIVQSNPSSEFAFPRYNIKGLTKANSASAALNKWMKPYVLISCTIHSFRHSMHAPRAHRILATESKLYRVTIYETVTL
ncbi:MAG: tyrosine-type recombinase/integrase [Proteobacteria bacterium]|nr:tyrosine-type recombinase/integrase [Pseudomonadota bacterium]